MAIVLVLLLLAVAVLVTLGAILVGSLVFGGILVATSRARFLAPMFFVLIPTTVVSTLLGGVVVGYLAVRANENFIFLGPLGGLVLGGLIGLSVGLAGAMVVAHVASSSDVGRIMTSWITIGLTNRSSQPLAVAMPKFNFMKQFSEFATLAAASGGSALSR